MSAVRGAYDQAWVVQNNNACKKVILCAPSQAKPQSLRPSCCCVSGPFALCTSSHAIKVHRAINSIYVLSDQPCVTRATYSLFRGASLEKGAISDCIAWRFARCKMDIARSCLWQEQQGGFLQNSELLLLLLLRSGVRCFSQGTDPGHKLQEQGRFSSFLLALAFW